MANFSVEDILKEVKGMTGDNYYSKSDETSYEKEDPQPEVEKTVDDEQINLFSQPIKEPEVVEDSQVDLPKEEVLEVAEPTPEPASISAQEFIETISENTNFEKDSVEIIGGFSVRTDIDFSSDKQEETIEDDSEEIEQQTKIFEKVQPTQSIVENTEPVEHEEIKEVLEIPEEIDEISEQIKEIPEETKETSQVEFVDIPLKREHTPSHLLSADEIKSGHMGEAPSLRFEDKLKDLANFDNDDFASFKKPDDTKSVDEENEELFDILSEKYDKQESIADKISAQPDVLNNDIYVQEEVVEKAEVEEIFSYTKEKEAIDLETPVQSTSDNRFTRKTMRKIEEKPFDYSDVGIEDEDEEIDDYTCIEDEEAVRYDLDSSLRSVTNRLGFTIIACIVSFVISALPTLGVDLFGFISPNSNLTGFLIANAIVLGFGVIVNIASFFRGLFSLVTFRPDCDSPLSIATLFVVLQSALAFVPEVSASADVVPFYTPALLFAYILSLIGKKAMMVRIKSNFRFVATTSLKQSCFVADETFGEMIENDDFIGAPYVATSKGAIDLQDYLKNSYCEDPSDNSLKLFAPISLLATIVTFVFTYFATKDIAIAFSYACAVSILAVPASAIIGVNSPLKKVALMFRQKDGLLSGYNAVNEFSDVDCVAISSEDLFPAGSVELKSLRAIGDVSIEDVILKSASLGIAAGGPLSDVFDKIIDGRRKMLSDVSDIVYEDGFGLTGKVDGKTVRIGNRQFMESYAISGLVDESVDMQAKAEGLFVVYTAIDDEVCGMFALKYKSIDPDIEDAIYDLLSNDIALAVKTNDPNITPELIADVFDISEDYVLIMEAHTAEFFDEITRASRKGDSILAYGDRFSTFAQLIVACKKLQTKISVSTIIQIIFTILGFGFCMFNAVIGNGFEYISISNIILYQLAVSIITVFIPSIIKRIK